MMKHSDEFKQEAARIALTSGLSRERVVKDLGIGNTRRRHSYLCDISPLAFEAKVA